MSTVLATQKSTLPAFMQAVIHAELPNELESNVNSSYAVVSVKGKSFAIKYGDEKQFIMDAEGFASRYFDVVIVSANAHLNKTYYATTFDDEAAERPDCWSSDGVKPDAGNPVHHTCATCPKNAFGSKVSDNGSKGKACSDSRKLVVLPVSDLRNDRFGGGMLLRVSPSGLNDLAQYNKKLRSGGAPYYAVVTRLTFDDDLAYPKMQYEAKRYLTEEEFNVVMEARASEQTLHILTSSFVETAVETEDATLGARPAHIAQEEAPAPVEPAPAKPRAPRAVKPKEVEAPAPAPAPVIQAPAPVQVPEDLTARLNSLFG